MVSNLFLITKSITTAMIDITTNIMKNDEKVVIGIPVDMVSVNLDRDIMYLTIQQVYWQMHLSRTIHPSLDKQI